MEFRELGRTRLTVGAIGLGTEYLHGQPRETVTAVVAEATERGVNYIDIIFSFSQYLDNLGAALAKRRDAVILALHLGCAETDGQYRRSRDVEECRRNFDDMLRRLRTDHADVIVVQNCDEQDDYDGSWAREAYWSWRSVCDRRGKGGSWASAATACRCRRGRSRVGATMC